jgi:hypothetical protein
VSSDGRVCETEGAGHGELGNTGEGEEIAGDTSVKYFITGNSRNSDQDSSQEAGGRSEEACTSLFSAMLLLRLTFVMMGQRRYRNPTKPFFILVKCPTAVVMRTQ